MEGQTTITQQDINRIFGWFNVYMNEVDIQRKDMEVFQKVIEPNLPEEYRGMIMRIYERWEQDSKYY